MIVWNGKDLITLGIFVIIVVLYAIFRTWLYFVNRKRNR